MMRPDDRLFKSTREHRLKKKTGRKMEGQERRLREMYEKWGIRMEAEKDVWKMGD